MVLLLSLWFLIFSGLTSCSDAKVVREAPSGGSDMAMHPDLLGTWYFNCKLPMLDDPTKGSYRYTGELEIKKTQLIYTQVQHFDNECKVRAAVFKTVESYVPQGKLDGSESAYKWDWRTVSNEKTYIDPSLIASANTASEFEYTDWAVNVPKNIAGKKFDSNSKPNPPSGSESFLIYKIADGEGYFMTSDAVNDGKTASKRRVGLNENVKFLKRSSGN